MATKAKVYIEGEVCSWGYYSSISGIREMLDYQGRFDEIEVTINSNGGDIAEGFGIYDLLLSYNVPITTIVIGQCCSAATVIFLAGSTRIIFENVLAFMVHKARGNANAPATADELHTIADYIASYDERMKAIYMKKTGADEATVDEWMSKDTYMSAQEALEFGFATVISLPIEASNKARKRSENLQPIVYASRAYSPPVANSVPPVAASTESDPQNQSQIMSFIRDKMLRLLASASALTSNKPIVAKAYALKDGSKININETSDQGFSEGDVVTKDEKPVPDGSLTLADDTELVIKDGKIDDIKKEESDDVEAKGDGVTATQEEAVVTASGDETPDLAAENARLTAENTTLRTQLSDANTRLGTVEAKVTQIAKAMGEKVSQDIVIPASKPKTDVSAKANTNGEDSERATMLAKRKAIWAPAEE